MTNTNKDSYGLDGSSSWIDWYSTDDFFGTFNITYTSEGWYHIQYRFTSRKGIARLIEYIIKQLNKLLIKLQK